MASEEEEKDEMGSLFEGMVLIDPSLRADDGGGGDGGGGDGDGDGDDDDQLQEQQESISFSSHTCRYTSSSPASHPLDENLFTDLTLITPDSQLPARSDPSDTSSTSTTMSNREISSSSLSRQISTKKKKRAGLKRIGYGRDAPIPPYDQHIDGQSLEFDHSSPPPPLPSLLLSDESESGRSAPHQRRQVHQKEELEQEEEEEEASLSSTATIKMESDYSAPHQRRQVHQKEELEQEEEEEASLSSTATIKMEIDYSETTCSDGADPPSHYNLANGASRDEEDDSVVSDAKLANLTGIISKDQLKTSAPNAIELRYDQIRAQISQKLRHVRELISSVSAARKDSRRSRRKAAETVNIASTRYRQLEKELEEACEAEDFETAERVSESLASAEKDKERLAITLRHAEEDCDAVDSRMHQVLELQIAAEEECSALLKNFAMVGTISLIAARGY